MHSLFLFAGRLPGGLAILMGDGFQMTYSRTEGHAPARTPTGRAGPETPPV